jgi:hypothetical protein
MPTCLLALPRHNCAACLLAPRPGAPGPRRPARRFGPAHPEDRPAWQSPYGPPPRRSRVRRWVRVEVPAATSAEYGPGVPRGRLSD